MIKQKFLFLGLVLLGILFAGVASAQPCPVCVVAIGAGLGFSRWFGIDDLVSSVWIGVMFVSLISWTLVYMKKKGWGFHDDGVIITLSYIVLTYIPLYYAGIVGHPQNQIWGIDKIIAGSIIGGTAVYMGYGLHLYLKKKNNNKSYFAYQRVAIPILILLITSIVLWKII